MRKIAASLLLVCICFFMTTGPYASAAESDYSSSNCIYIVDAKQYEDVYTRLLPGAEFVDFLNNGGSFAVYIWTKPIENCIQLSVPIKITSDDPQFDYSDTVWYTFIRDHDSGQWYADPDHPFHFKDGEWAIAEWYSSETRTIDGVTVIPFSERVTPGFDFQMRINGLAFGFPDQLSAQKLSGDMKKKTDKQTELRNEDDTSVAIFDNLRKGVIHVYIVQIDNDGHVVEMRGATGFAVGAPGTSAQYFITTIDNVVTIDSYNNPDNYRLILIADDSYYNNVDIKLFLPYEDSIEKSIAILELEEAIDGREPLSLCEADGLSAGEEIIILGYDRTSIGEGAYEHYPSYPDEELMMKGVITGEKDMDDPFGWLTTSIDYTEGMVGSPVFNSDGYVIGMCTSEKAGDATVILASNAIIETLKHDGTPYGVLLD